MKFLLSLIQIILLFAGYGVFFNQWVRPSVFPFFNLLALIFPIVFVLNIVLIICWFFYKPKLGIIFLILCIPFVSIIDNTFRIFNSDSGIDSDLKVMTLNHYYDRIDNVKTLQFLNQEKPDIVLLQEVQREPNIYFQTENYKFEYINHVAFASKFPIIESKTIELEEPNLEAAYADILIHSDTIRFVNVHLASMFIDRQLLHQQIDEKDLQKTTGILRQRFTKAFIKHEKQIDEIRKYIAKSPHPVILGGDFNAVPNSYEYYQLGRGLQDAFGASQERFAATYHGFRYPIKIDYIFTSPQIKASSHRVGKMKISDHSPIIVTLELPKDK